MSLLHRIGVLALTCLVVIAGAHASGAKAVAPAAEFRVMSFNVRNSAAQDGENIWANRVELFFETIHQFKPDVIGFQEVLADQHDAIVQHMPDYAFCGGARNDGKRSGEWSLVGFRRDRLIEISHGDFWLSEQPTVPGSKSWDAALTRLCSWVQLKERSTGREFIFANTHFDHKGVIARRESSRLLSKKLAAIADGRPVILTGDFNFFEDDPGYATLVHPEQPGALSWIDSYRSLHPQRSPDESSFNGFKGTVAGSRIDFIFHTTDFKALQGEIVRSEPRNGRWPSDHYAVTAILGWK